MTYTIEILRNADLRTLNSFGVAARATALARVASREQLLAALDLAASERLRVEVLGGGSNVLIVEDLDALVLLPELRGIDWLGLDHGRMHVRAAAGEPWHAFVGATLARGAFGLENLALIPGHVGAAPIQNIGAYGVELDQFVVAVEVYDCQQRAFRRLAAADCGFSYRDSLFKRPGGDRYVIVAVEFALSAEPHMQLDYAGIRDELAAGGIALPTPMDVYRAVCAIRQRKLPDPAVLGNAGSFFKNPLVTAAQAQQLRTLYPALPVYAAGQGSCKLAAGWMIEQCGWKGAREGDAGVHRQHALVLVNYGNASGRDLLALAERIRADVAARYSVTLEIEPRVLRR